MASKELGMIHTANTTVNVTSPATTKTYGSVDIPGELTKQLNRLVRNGNFFKVVGIDMTLDTTGTVGGGQVTGYLRYYAPTRGRCQAYRSAFKAMATVMKNQGISMRDNHMYDFRVPLTNQSNVVGGPFPNQATLDGSDGLVMCTVDSVGDPTDPGDGRDVTWIHNRSVQPQYQGSDENLFTPGFDTLQQSNAAGTDFVLNDTVPYTGNEDAAERTFEYIPFMLSWSPDQGSGANENRLSPVSFNWKPDPALYLAVLGGQFDVYIEELNVNDGAPALNLNVAVHVSGWKSIMGDPDKKKSSRRTNRTRK